MRLLESSATRRRSRGGTAASILVHVLVIGSAVFGTATAGIPDDAPREVALPAYVAPRPEPAREHAKGPATANPNSAAVASNLRPPPQIPFVEPIGIPPIAVGPPTVSVPADSFASGGLKSGPGEPAGAPSGAPAGDGPWTRDFVERPAMPLGPVRPRYPDALRDAGIGGRVVLRFVVDTLGRVEPATVETTSATDPRFGEAARRAIGGLRFRPAEAGGRRVRQLVELPFDFVIQ
jgi:protein TonB